MVSILERKLRWQEKQAEFAYMTDRTGMPIDAGILETVIALNTLGIYKFSAKDVLFRHTYRL